MEEAEEDEESGGRGKREATAVSHKLEEEAGRGKEEKRDEDSGGRDKEESRVEDEESGRLRKRHGQVATELGTTGLVEEAREEKEEDDERGQEKVNTCESEAEEEEGEDKDGPGA